MARYTSLICVITLVAIAAPADALGQGFFTAKFSADQETGDVTSSATGTAVLGFRDGELSYFVTVEGLTGDITGAHFHNAEAGVSGGVVRDIGPDFEGTTAIGVWTGTDPQPLTEELILELFAGNLYLNIHTGAYPAGEIRAQIVHTDGVTLTADLTPEQETHDVESSGRGTAIVQVSEAGAAFYVSVDSLTGTIGAAHFHNGPAGVNGGVVRGITSDFDGNTAIGLWKSDDPEPLTDDLVVELLKGNLYLNVHTAMYGAGEIRGQLNLTTGWAFQASLDADQADGSTGTGFGTAALTMTTDGLVYDVTVTDLTGPITNAHFHRAPPGTGGPVVHGIFDAFTGNTATGIWGFDDDEPLTNELITALFNGELYINIHTGANPPGEIRGQVLRAGGTGLAASLTPEQEPGEVTQEASGTAHLTLFVDRLDFELTVDNLSGDITGAHFHRAEMGANGGVVKDIGPSFTGTHASGSWTTADATQPLSDELRTALLLGELYLNVHTSANPGGEVRGQVILSGGTAIRANLTSEQETEEVTQGAAGTAAMVLTEAGLVYRLTVENLSGPPSAAHFHTGSAGQDGGVVEPISSDFAGNTAAGFWPTGDPVLSPELRNDLLAGRLYINVHTDANPPGELRGQTRLASGIGSGVELSAGQQTGMVTSDGRGTAALNLSAEGVTFDITVDGLTGDITNAHFHAAPVGMDGGPVRTIASAFEGQTAFGMWRENDGEPFTVERLTEYINGGIYLNIHTAENPAGEIRGQIGAGELVATGIERVNGQIPQSFRLSQNYPNPFNPSTTIEFDLTRTSPVRLKVFNALGQLVRTLVDDRLTAGTYRVMFDAESLPSGLYVYRLETDADSRIRKMLFVK